MMNSRAFAPSEVIGGRQPEGIDHRNTNHVLTNHVNEDNRMSVADSTGKDVASNRLMGDLQMPNAQGGGSLASRIGAADGQFGWLQSSPLFAWFSKKKFPASRSKRIDVVARIVFPIIFAIFNLSYWTFYLLRDPGPQLP